MNKLKATWFSLNAINIMFNSEAFFKAKNSKLIIIKQKKKHLPQYEKSKLLSR